MYIYTHCGSNYPSIFDGHYVNILYVTIPNVRILKLVMNIYTNLEHNPEAKLGEVRKAFLLLAQLCCWVSGSIGILS
jgi:hypothetical protein